MKLLYLRNWAEFLLRSAFKCNRWSGVGLAFLVVSFLSFGSMGKSRDLRLRLEKMSVTLKWRESDRFVI